MSHDCDCCQGIERLTPEAIVNRPGLPALSCRVGRHSTFLATMLARLSSLCGGAGQDCNGGRGPYPLRERLTIRVPEDPSIALLDAWSTVADVLTFYQERLVNEGYLRTATERRSILELAALVGHRLRPAVSASAHLAFEVEKDAGEIVIPQGTAVQTVPGQNELPQTFETFADLTARPEWNEIRPRLTRPQNITPSTARSVPTIYVHGTTTNVTPDDVLVLVVPGSPLIARHVEAVEIDSNYERTKIILQPDPLSTAHFIDTIRSVTVGFVHVLFDAALTKPHFVMQIGLQLDHLLSELQAEKSLVTLDTDVDAKLTSLTRVTDSSDAIALVKTFSAFEQIDAALQKFASDSTALMDEFETEQADESHLVADLAALASRIKSEPAPAIQDIHKAIDDLINVAERIHAAALLGQLMRLAAAVDTLLNGIPGEEMIPGLRAARALTDIGALKDTADKIAAQFNGTQQASDAYNASVERSSAAVSALTLMLSRLTARETVDDFAQVVKGIQEAQEGTKHLTLHSRLGELNSILDTVVVTLKQEIMATHPYTPPNSAEPQELQSLVVLVSKVLGTILGAPDKAAMAASQMGTLKSKREAIRAWHESFKTLVGRFEIFKERVRKNLASRRTFVVDRVAVLRERYRELRESLPVAFTALDAVRMPAALAVIDGHLAAALTHMTTNARNARRITSVFRERHDSAV